MNVSVERLKIKKVLCQEKYQEVFFRKMRLDASESLRIYDCEADISSLLKKSFWGCRSVIEIHSLKNFPVKLYLDGRLLTELNEMDYPDELKIRLLPEEDRNKAFADKLSVFLQTYPPKDDFDVVIYSLPSIWLRAYACALLGKARKKGLLKDDLQKRRYALMLDLLKMLDKLARPVEATLCWDDCLSGDRFVPEDKLEEVAQKMEVQGCDRLVLKYLVCLLSRLYHAYREDIINLDAYVLSHYGLFSSKKIDKYVLLRYNAPLSLCCLEKGVKNYIVTEPLSIEEIRYYLSLQNW